MENISVKDQWKVWSKVALHSFGGPAGQIAIIHKLIVEEKKYVSEERFLHALNFCMLLPGPEAQQLATYLGWLMNKWKGGLLAGCLFILPGFISMLCLSYIYVMYQDLTFVQGLFYGLKPAIIAIVVGALLHISKRSLHSAFHWSLAVLAFMSLFFFNIPFPTVVIGSAIIGGLHGFFFTHYAVLEKSGALTLPPIKKTLKILSVWLFIWFAPVLIIFILFGENSTFHSLNLFFSKMSIVTFGGAYSALTYVAQKAVNTYGWLQGTEMLDGLAMAKTTPGPLIQVVQFVGFMAAYRFSDLSSPYLSAFVGSLLTTWMTFAPCFLWIFVFAPYVEFIRGQKIFSNALKAITASVVGVIFNLSLWFVLKAIFPNGKIDFFASAICLVAITLQFYFKRGLFTILGTSMLLGLLVVHWR